MRKSIFSLILIPLVVLVILTPLSFASQSTTNVNKYVNKIVSNLTLSSNLLNKLDGNDGYYSTEAFQLMPSSNVTPVKVTIAINANFSDSGMKPYTKPVYIPPGNYDLILLNVSIKELGGAQYDRALYIYVNGTPIF